MDFHDPLERRNVDFQRRDVDFHDPLEHRNVDFQRRDVDFNEPLERRDVAPQRRDVVNSTLCHVATLLIPLSVTSRRCPVLRPRTVHFCSSPRTHHYRNPRPLTHLSSPALLELPSTPIGGSYSALRPSLRTSESPAPTGSGSLWHSYHTVLGSSLGVVF